MSSTTERFLFELGTYFAFFFQQSICPGVALSKVLLAQAAQTQYVSLNEYINIHMDKLLRWVVETPMD